MVTPKRHTAQERVALVMTPSDLGPTFAGVEVEAEVPQAPPVLVTAKDRELHGLRNLSSVFRSQCITPNPSNPSIDNNHPNPVRHHNRASRLTFEASAPLWTA